MTIRRATLCHFKNWLLALPCGTLRVAMERQGKKKEAAATLPGKKRMPGGVKKTSKDRVFFMLLEFVTSHLDRYVEK